jgi:hypothetical protein
MIRHQNKNSQSKELGVDSMSGPIDREINLRLK